MNKPKLKRNYQDDFFSSKIPLNIFLFWRIIFMNEYLIDLCDEYDINEFIGLYDYWNYYISPYYLWDI